MVGFFKVLLDGSPAQAYNIGNPKPEVSMLDLVKALERVTGRRLPVETVEYPDTYPGDEPQRRCPDISKAAVQLSYRPKVTLDQGLRRFMTWARAHYAGARAS